MNLSTFKQTRLRKVRAQKSDKLFYQHRHSNPLTPEKDPSRTCRFARTKREEEQKVFFYNRKEIKRVQKSRDRTQSIEKEDQQPITQKSTRTSRFARTERRLKHTKDFHRKEIEDQWLLAIAGIEPSSLEPALNPALQSWKLNLAPQDLAELRVTRGQRGASSI